MDFYKQGMTIGDTFTINIQGKTSVANDMITIKSGAKSASEIYPKSYFEIIPIYDVITF